MSLTAADVAEIVRLLEESSFDELTLEIDGLKLCLRRGASASRPVVAEAEDAPPAVEAVAPSCAGAAASVDPGVDPDVYEVRSPLLGTFYRAPKPGAPPFVEVGSTVEEDTVVGLIEVMKLMNAVHAGAPGVVREIPAGDGKLVEHGEVLVRIGRTD